MKITSIETFQRDAALSIVRVRTDDGHEGWGQTSTHSADVATPILHKLVAPYFLGKDPWDIDVLANEFVRSSYKFPSTFVLRALTGIDTAIWDLLGKATGQPVYKLLGGKARDSVPVYASSMRRETTAEWEVDRFSDEIAKHGFRCVKIKIGKVMGRDQDESAGRTEKFIPLVREVLGDDVDIHADANGCYSAPQAIRVGRVLEDYGYAHFEEPCPYQEIENTAKVAAALDMPVAGGEQDAVMEQFYRMITTGAVDIIQPDIGYIGGMARTRRVVHMAQAAGIPATPHCANQSLIQVFNLHLAMSSPVISQYQEWSIERELEDYAYGLYDPMPVIVDGNVTLSDAPGWGIDIDSDFLRSAERQVTELKNA